METDEEIRHVVLAGLTAAHAIEFIPITDLHVHEQLASERVVEACAVDISRRIKGLGTRIRQTLGRGAS